MEQELPRSGLLTLRVPDWLKLVLTEVENLLVLVPLVEDGAGPVDLVSLERAAPPLALLWDSGGSQEDSGPSPVLGGCSPQVLDGSCRVPDDFLKEEESSLMDCEGFLGNSAGPETRAELMAPGSAYLPPRGLRSNQTAAVRQQEVCETTRQRWDFLPSRLHPSL